MTSTNSYMIIGILEPSATFNNLRVIYSLSSVKIGDYDHFDFQNSLISVISYFLIHELTQYYTLNVAVLVDADF